MQHFYSAVGRLNNFIVWLSNTLPNVGQPMNTNVSLLCNQYVGSVPASGSVYVTCLWNTSTFRYVIIQSSKAMNALCLTEVQVYIGWYLNVFCCRKRLSISILFIFRVISVLHYRKLSSVHRSAVTVAVRTTNECVAYPYEMMTLLRCNESYCNRQQLR
jgi:hypothetical protein